MKQIALLLISLIFLVSSGYAQSTALKGTVLDKDTKESIAFATIVLYNTNELVDGVLADEAGEFQLETTKAFTHLEVSFMGYKKERLLFSEIATKKELSIALDLDDTTLETVVINAKKTSTQLKIDRKVIHLGSDIQQSGVNALEAFDQITEVQTDLSNGTISLRGSDNVRVLINGKPSSLSAVELLQQIPVSSINRIEIITSPSAKHKADGLSGIINVVLKKNSRLGFNLGVNTAAGTKRHSIGVAGNYNSAALNFRWNASKSSLKMTNEQTIKREFGDGTTEQIFTPYKFDGDVLKLATGFDFFINEKHEFSVGIDYTDDAHSYFNKSSYTNVTARDNYTFVRENEHSHEISIFNANYRLKFNEDTHFLELDYQVNSSKNDYPITDFEDGNFLFDQDLTENFVLQSFAIDYTLPLMDTMIVETGISRNTQELKSQSVLTSADNAVIDNRFTYDESLIGIYALVKLSLNKFNIQAGLRFEHFKSMAVSVTNDFSSQQQFSNVFPSAHLSYSIDDTSTLNFGYSKRVSRPNFHHVNAFQIVSPLYVWQYNPDITPELSDNLELGYLTRFKGLRLGLTSFYRQRKNVILWVESSSDNMQTFRYENAGTFNSYGLEANVNYTMTPYWNSALTANYYHTNIDQSVAVTWDKTYSSSIQFKNTFNITKDMTADISYLYRAKQQRTFAYVEPRSSLDLAVSLKLMNDKLSASLRIVDLFNSNGFNKHTRTANLRQETNWEFQSSRAFNFLFSLNYKILEHKIKSRNRKNRTYNDTPID